MVRFSWRASKQAKKPFIRASEVMLSWALAGENACSVGSGHVSTYKGYTPSTNIILLRYVPLPNRFFSEIIFESVFDFKKYALSTTFNRHMNR